MICVRFVRSPGKDDQQASGMCSVTIQESFLGWRYEYGSNMHGENDWESGDGWGHPGRVWRVRWRRVYKTLEGYWYIKSGRRLCICPLLRHQLTVQTYWGGEGAPLCSPVLWPVGFWQEYQVHQWRRKSSSTNGAETADVHMRKNEVGPQTHTIEQNELPMEQWPKYTNLEERRMGENLFKE